MVVPFEVRGVQWSSIKKVNVGVAWFLLLCMLGTGKFLLEKIKGIKF